MSLLEYPIEELSVSDASARGIAGLVRDAEVGRSIVVSRHGRPVAAVVAMARFDSIEALEDDLRSACLVLARAATDNGKRIGLPDLLNELGFEEQMLTAELDVEQGKQASRKSRKGKQG